MPDFREKFGSTALITGASSGIGEAYARDLAGKKIDLVLIARRKERLNKLRQELEKAHGISVTVLAKDLSLPQSAGDVYSELSQAGVQVDILINNAGFGSSGQFQELPRERELAMVDLNCRLPVELTHLFLPGMQERNRGAIIIVSSVLGFFARPKATTYAATKAFDLLFGEGLYGELKKTKIAVLTICPGLTQTEFQEAAGIDPKTIPLKFRSSEQVVATTWKSLGKLPTAVDGTFNKGVTYLARILPRKWVVWLVSRSEK